MNSASVQSRIEQKIRNSLNPQHLDIINESHLHAGHQEKFDGQGETHFRIVVVAESFSGMSRIARHRAINALVEDEMEHGLHAIAITAKTPDELKQ